MEKSRNKYYRKRKAECYRGNTKRFYPRPILFANKYSWHRRSSDRKTRKQRIRNATILNLTVSYELHIL